VPDNPAVPGNNVPGNTAPRSTAPDNQEPPAQIDYDSGEKVYLQIARIIRDRIINGELPVGAQVPSGSQMRQEWGVNRLTGAQAVDELRKSGLVVTKPGVGTFVAATPKLQIVDLFPGDKVIARMPSEDEREALATGYLTPVLIITRSDGTVEPYNAAVTVCRTQDRLPDPAPVGNGHGMGLGACDVTGNKTATRDAEKARQAG
jgi:DNA-binding transcriptional regulator YhcF (GntR family)